MPKARRVAIGSTRGRPSVSIPTLIPDAPAPASAGGAAPPRRPPLPRRRVSPPPPTVPTAPTATAGVTAGATAVAKGGRSRRDRVRQRGGDAARRGWGGGGALPPAPMGVVRRGRGPRVLPRVPSRWQRRARTPVGEGRHRRGPLASCTRPAAACAVPRHRARPPRGSRSQPPPSTPKSSSDQTPGGRGRHTPRCPPTQPTDGPAAARRLAPPGHAAQRGTRRQRAAPRGRAAAMAGAPWTGGRRGLRPEGSAGGARGERRRRPPPGGRAPTSARARATRGATGGPHGEGRQRVTGPAARRVARTAPRRGRRIARGAPRRGQPQRRRLPRRRWRQPWRWGRLSQRDWCWPAAARLGVQGVGGGRRRGGQRRLCARGRPRAGDQASDAGAVGQHDPRRRADTRTTSSGAHPAARPSRGVTVSHNYLSHLNPSAQLTRLAVSGLCRRGAQRGWAGGGGADAGGLEKNPSSVRQGAEGVWRCDCVGAGKRVQ